MKKIDIARALRDSEYRSRLSNDELASLPLHPAGHAVVADEALQSVTGGCGGSACSCGGTTFLFSCVPPGSNCP